MLNPQVKTGPDVGFTNYPDMNWEIAQSE
jgi:hypothetical protein